LAADPLFEIGNHTVDHLTFRVPCYGLAAATNRRWEITESQQMIQAAAGTAPPLLRFPGDCYTREDVSLAHELGLTVISGDVRAGDGFNPSAAAIASRVESQTRPGSIVVMHLHGDQARATGRRGCFYAKERSTFWAGTEATSFNCLAR
jgi:peptidoglycan-N-acetylglucosamine deacetylase